MTFSIWQIAIVLVIAVLVFGPKSFRVVGQSLRAGAREFRDSITRTAARSEADVEVVDGELVEHRT